jgi:hypothetical protein
VRPLEAKPSINTKPGLRSPAESPQTAGKALDTWQAPSKSRAVTEFFNGIGCEFNRSLQHRSKSIGRRFKAQGFSGALV